MNQNYYPQNQQMNSQIIYQITRSNTARLKWTTDLHKCFVEAVYYLGGPIKVKPKTLIHEMNVPGLDLQQIKSHLQKYRLGSYKMTKQSRKFQKKGEKRTYKLRSQRSSSTSSTASSGEKIASGYFSGSSTTKPGYERQSNEDDESEQPIPKSQAPEPTLSSNDLDEAFNIFTEEDIAALMADISFGDEDLPPPLPTSFNASGHFGVYHPSPIMTDANKVHTHFEQDIADSNPNFSYIDDYLIPFEPVLSPVGVSKNSGNSVENSGNFLRSHFDLDEVHRFFDEMGW